MRGEKNQIKVCLALFTQRLRNTATTKTFVFSAFVLFIYLFFKLNKTTGAEHRPSV